MRENLSIPRHDQFSEVTWRKPTVAAILSTLKNPAYAGAFVYGKTKFINARRQKQLPQTEWKITVKDKYPAYIEWETWQKVQTMIKDNHAEYSRNKNRGIPRPGKALLHGIVYCGECGHKLLVQYKPSTKYLCNALRQQYGVPVCQFIPADPVDKWVVQAFFDALSPVEMNAYAESKERYRETNAVVTKAHLQQLQRLRYDSSLAERQFKRVDPDNRLVADELERRWESALQELKRAEREFENQANPFIQSDLLSPELKRAFEDVGKNLPDLWRGELIERQKKKELLRCLIDKVVLRRAVRDQIEVRIVWKGGDTTTNNLPLVRTADGNRERLYWCGIQAGSDLGSLKTMESFRQST